MTEKIINWLTTVNAKYLAITTKPRSVYVIAPMYFDNDHMSRGRKKPKKAAIAEGSTPATSAYVVSDVVIHVFKKGIVPERASYETIIRDVLEFY